MSEGQLISLVVSIGALILVGSELRGNRIGAKKSLGMALIWIGIIGAVALIFDTMQ